MRNKTHKAAFCAATYWLVVGCGPAEPSSSDVDVGTGQAAISSGPTTMNPMLVSTMPGAPAPDWAGWNSYFQSLSASTPAPLATLTRAEIEPNNTRQTATRINGLGTGPGEQTAATATGSIAVGPTGTLDFFGVDLEVGDVIGANLLGAFPTQDPSRIEIGLVDPNGVLRIRSTADRLTALLPVNSPLPRGGGGRSLAYVAELAGTWTVRVQSFATTAVPNTTVPYNVQLVTQRPPLEQATPGTKQILFLDFDGAVLNTRAEFSRAFPPEILNLLPEAAVLSPFRNFLPGFGLTTADESAAIDRIIAVVRENLVDDIRQRGKNQQFDVDIRNSRDHAEPTGPNVGKVIIGGTVQEFAGPQVAFFLQGVVGISPTIDVGNFRSADPVVVLPELLGGVQRAPGLSGVELAGRTVGAVASHEVGHMAGNFHTETNTGSIAEGPLVTVKENLMDPFVQEHAGLGADSILGSADDVDVDFGFGGYRQQEGFSSPLEPAAEDTLNTFAFGLDSPCIVRPLAEHLNANRVTSRVVTIAIPFVGNFDVLLFESVGPTPAVVAAFGLPPASDQLGRLIAFLDAVAQFAPVRKLPAGGFGVCTP